MGESQIVLMIITPLRETLYKYMGFKEAPAFMTIEMMWLNFFQLSFFGVLLNGCYFCSVVCFVLQVLTTSGF